MQISCILLHFPCFLENAHMSIKMHAFSSKCTHFHKTSFLNQGCLQVRSFFRKTMNETNVQLRVYQMYLAQTGPLFFGLLLLIRKTLLDKLKPHLKAHCKLQVYNVNHSFTQNHTVNCCKLH